VNTLRQCWEDNGLKEYCGDGQWYDLANGANSEALFKLFNEYGVKVLDANSIEYEAPDEPLPDEFFVRFQALVNLTFYRVTEVEAELK
jgi:hypothetical protein